MPGTDDKGGNTGVSYNSIFTLLAIAAYSLFELMRPGRHSLPAKVVYGVMTVICGALALLLFVLELLGVGKIKSAATKIDALNRKMYTPVHEKRIVEESTITEYGLDADFYRQATRSMEALGFQRLHDVINLTLQRAMPSARSVVRTFLGDKGRSMGAVYDVKMSGATRALQAVGAIPKKLRAVEFESELSDGTFVTTSDAMQAAKASEFPGISRRFVPQGTAPADILAEHHAHVQAVLATKPTIVPLIFHSFEDLSASQDRLQMIKSQHRNSSAFNPAEQVARIIGKPLTPEQADVAQRAADLHARRTSAPMEPPAQDPSQL